MIRKPLSTETLFELFQVSRIGWPIFAASAKASSVAATARSLHLLLGLPSLKPDQAPRTRRQAHLLIGQLPILRLVFPKILQWFLVFARGYRSELKNKMLSPLNVITFSTFLLMTSARIEPICVL